MKKIITLLFLCFYAFAKAQTIDAALITNIKQNNATETSEITNISGTPLEGSLLYDSTRKGGYIYDGTDWRRIYFAPRVDEKTASYTLLPSDDGNVLKFTGTADVTLTVPAGLDIAFNISVYQLGTGKVTIVAASGATVNNRLSRYVLAGQNAGAGIICTAVNTYHVTGDLKRN